MSQTYYAILTAIGEAKLANAAALNTTLKIAKMAVGDGGGAVPTPTRSQTTLAGEWYRAGLNTLSVDPSNSSQIIAELVIPEATGGNWIREMGLYDSDGNLIAVANTPPSYKPQLAEGSGRTQVLRMILVVSSTSAVELKIDPSIILATRQYVDDAITVAVNRLDFKQSVRVATTANLALSGTPTVDGIPLAAGDRILVKNQDNASQNGLYLVAAGNWSRTLDADASSEVTPGLTVYVEQGTTQTDSLWKLVTDAPIALGITALAFADITSGYAPLKSPAFTDKPTAPTAELFDVSKLLANTEYVQRALGNLAGLKVISASAALDKTSAGNAIVLDGTPGIVYLPSAVDCPRGSQLVILVKQPGWILSTSNNQLLDSGAATVSSMTLNTGDQVTLFSNAANSWAMVGGSAGLPYSTEFKRRTRGIAASISSGGQPAANAAFSWVKNYPTFVAPCDGLVILTSNVNVGSNSNPEAVINLAKITGSRGGSSSSSDGTLNPMTNTAVMPVSRGETVTVTSSCSGSATNVTWSAMNHNTAYWFIPSNNLAV